MQYRYTDTAFGLSKRHIVLITIIENILVRKIVFIAFCMTFLSQWCIPSRVEAYIDPNTGGYVFQLLFPIVSGIAAAYIFFKRQVIYLKKRVVGLFTNRL